jgi:hypothetical protein
VEGAIMLVFSIWSGISFESQTPLHEDAFDLHESSF